MVAVVAAFSRFGRILSHRPTADGRRPASPPSSSANLAVGKRDLESELFHISQDLARARDIDLFEIFYHSAVLLDQLRELHEPVLAFLVGLASEFVLIVQCMRSHTFQTHVCTQCKTTRPLAGVSTAV